MYKMVFNIESNLSFPLLSIFAFIVSIVILILFKLKYSRFIVDRFKRGFLYFSLIFIVFFLGIVSIEKIKIYYVVKDAIKNNKYKSIEGRVSHFIAAPYTGHKEESFTIVDKHFSYSDYENTIFYHKTISHGGIIRDGECLKIDYLVFLYTGCLPFVKYLGYSCPKLEKNKIIRLWIKR